MQTVFRVVAVTALVMLAACSARPKPENLEMLGQVEAAIAAAESQDAKTYAADHLAMARDKLARARNAIAEDEFSKAQRLSEQALLDARLAMYSADLAKTSALVSELERSNVVLRGELDLQ